MISKIFQLVKNPTIPPYANKSEMNFHKLLERQIRKYLPGHLQTDESMNRFFRAINDSYVSFEKDQEMTDHAFKLTEIDYAEVNKTLKREIDHRKASVQRLAEAVKAIDDSYIFPDNWEDTDLIVIADYLKLQIEKRNKAVEDKVMAIQAAKAKSDFLSMMSHEIRTPLNAVIGIANLLSEEELLPSQLDNLRVLQFSAENLLALINDILDFSKIEAGKVEFEKNELDLHQLILNLTRANQIKADDNDNQLQLIIDKNVPQWVKGDSVRLGQILNNLVSNAVKFTQRGTVTIHIKCLEQTNEEAKIYFSVKDTGIGIEPAKQKVIFNGFTQASRDISRKFGGTGLGLSITQKLLDMMGGEICLESEYGKGSNFYFALTFAKGKAPNTVENDKQSQKVENLEGVRILVVEDNDINQLVATQFLMRWNAEVVDVAEDGKIGVEMARENHYDLILMDLQMPEMDGYAATIEIRKFNKTIPIIALTASVMLDSKDLVFEVGMNDFATKPFVPKELLKKIISYVKK
jgi:signal transduction histidine kinase